MTTKPKNTSAGGLIVATSLVHQFIAQLFRPPLTGNRLSLIEQPRFLELLTPPLPQMPAPPGARVRVESNEFTEIQQEHGEPVRVDQVLSWETDSARAVKLALVEVQFDIREDKRQRWLDYASLARSNFLGCPVVLVVIPNSAKAYRWCRRKIRSGSVTLQASVLVPKRLKRIIDVKEAVENPELTLLALAVHGGLEPRSPNRAAQLLAADRAAAKLDASLRGKYINSLAKSLSSEETKAFKTMSSTEITYDSLLTQEMRAELKEELQAQLREQLQAQLREQLQAQLREELQAQLREELIPQIRRDILVELALRLLAEYFEATLTPEQTAAITAATDEQLEVFVERARTLPKQTPLDDALKALSIDVAGGD